MGYDQSAAQSWYVMVLALLKALYLTVHSAYGYEEVIKAHFYLRKEAIFKEIEAWMETYNTNEFATTASKSRMEPVSRAMT